MMYLIAYVTILLVFGIIDAVWLSTMLNVLYVPVLGDQLIESVRIAPAVAFYLMYTAGILFFAVRPALHEESSRSALVYGGLLGAMCYATYDLTNYATLKNWTLTVTVIDIVYGAVTASICAWASYQAASWYKGRS